MHNTTFKTKINYVDNKVREISYLPAAYGLVVIKRAIKLDLKAITLSLSTIINNRILKSKFVCW